MDEAEFGVDDISEEDYNRLKKEVNMAKKKKKKKDKNYLKKLNKKKGKKNKNKKRKKQLNVEPRHHLYSDDGNFLYRSTIYSNSNSQLTVIFMQQCDIYVTLVPTKWRFEGIDFFF